jgi:hypothetical protein
MPERMRDGQRRRTSTPVLFACAMARPVRKMAWDDSKRAVRQEGGVMTQQQTTERRKLTPVEHAACAWPIVLVLIGGAIGGAAGGAAWAINTRIMASAMSAPMRYGLVVATGIGAFVLYLAIVFALATTFPGTFAAQ